MIGSDDEMDDVRYFSAQGGNEYATVTIYRRMEFRMTGIFPYEELLSRRIEA